MKFISDFYQQKASNKDSENNCIELMWAGENLTNISRRIGFHKLLYMHSN